MNAFYFYKINTESMKYHFLKLVLILVLFQLFNACSEKKSRIESSGERYEVPFKKQGQLIFISNEGDTIRKMELEIADTEEKRAQGLMYRARMSDSQAMLFLFEKEEPRSFWMKNTYISLDIIFADKEGNIVTIQKNTRPYSEDPVLSYDPALYVVEVVAGFCDLYGLEKGDRFVWRRN